jgi:cyclopropane-fatty-acyl-phospholipid synthase
MEPIVALAERGWLPDPVVRMGIRRLVQTRLDQEDRGDPELQARAHSEFVRRVRDSPVAVASDDANDQHYEVPAELFALMLGPRLKYSCCYWDADTSDLAAAEDDMLALTCERAQIGADMSVLELGCGWGSLTLWMAERFPTTTITAVSNSAGQRRHIEALCESRGLANVRVVTADMNEFDTERRYDRVVSVEMFEHMRNYPELMRRIATWLEPGGLLFVHIFCHRAFPYFYESSGPNDWMAREFFTGGTMPSDDLLLYFQEDLRALDHWRIGGTHYARTLEAWLARLDADRPRALEVLRRDHGDAGARRQLQRWRLFLLACSELFNYRGGREWWISHYTFRRPAS